MPLMFRQDFRFSLIFRLTPFRHAFAFLAFQFSSFASFSLLAAIFRCFSPLERHIAAGFH